MKLDKKNILIVILIAALALLVGMQISKNDNHMNDSSHMGGSSSNQTSYTSSDIMFAQMMIPHHQQAVEISDLALEKSTNQRVIDLARQIRDAQAPEITQMKKWLTVAGSALMGDHGMAMEGMLSDDEVSTLALSSGDTFDRLFLEGMIAHHEGALTMVSMIQDSENAEAKTLAANIKSSQSAEIKLMKGYLKSL